MPHITTPNRPFSALSRDEQVRSLLDQMAGESASDPVRAGRAERLEQIKDARPDLTWRQIADAAGVMSERSAHEWRKTGGITYEHARHLCEFLEVDLDWFWRGSPSETPDLMDRLNPEGRRQRQLDEIERRLREIQEAIDELRESVARIEKALRKGDLTRHFPKSGSPDGRSGSKARPAKAKPAKA